MDFSFDYDLISAWLFCVFYFGRAGSLLLPRPSVAAAPLAADHRLQGCALRCSGAPGAFPAQGWNPCLLTPGPPGEPRKHLLFGLQSGVSAGAGWGEGCCPSACEGACPAVSWCWPEPWGSLQEGREASPGGPLGTELPACRGRGLQAGLYGEAPGVCCCVSGAFCVSRVPCSLHMMSTPWSEAARWEGGGPPPGRRASLVQAPTTPALPAACGPSWPGGGAFTVSPPSLQGRPVGRTSYHIRPTPVRAPW